MDNYTYTSFEQSLKITDRPNIAKKMREEAVESDVSLYIDHQLLQCYQAAKDNYFDARYVDLYDAATEANEAKTSANINWYLSAMAKLGEAVARMDYPTVYEQLLIDMEFTKRKRDELASSMPILLKNINVSIFTRLAQEWARDIWVKDTEKKLRIGEVTEEVYSQVHQFAKKTDAFKHFPDKKETIRKWIKVVAPDYAQQKGRPKSKK